MGENKDPITLEGGKMESMVDIEVVHSVELIFTNLTLWELLSEMHSTMIHQAALMGGGFPRVEESVFRTWFDIMHQPLFQREERKTVYLLRLEGKKVEGLEPIQVLEKKGFTPAHIGHLLAFIRQEVILQSEFPCIVALSDRRRCGVTPLFHYNEGGHAGTCYEEEYDVAPAIFNRRCNQCNDPNCVSNRKPDRVFDCIEVEGIIRREGSRDYKRIWEKDTIFLGI